MFSKTFKKNFCNAGRLLLIVNEASTFNCNAGRLLFKNKTNKYTDSRGQEIVMSKMVTQKQNLLFSKWNFVPQIARGLTEMQRDAVSF